MSITGFNIDGNIEKYDYNSLENIPDFNGGSEEWELVAEVTATENVNSIYASFDACKAVRVQFMFGAVEGDLGTIGIAPNCRETFYLSEDRACAASVITSSSVKRGWVYVEIDTRGNKVWMANSANHTRGDGSFNTEIAYGLNGAEIGISNMRHSIMSDWYFNNKNLEDGIKSITACGAGMVKGTTLWVWGIKK